MPQSSDVPPSSSSSTAPSLVNSNALPTDFGHLRFRLNAKQWLFVILGLLPLVFGISPLWKRWESFPHPPDYRLPYQKSQDYWLYQRHLETPSHAPQQFPVYVVGDSVIWGDYVDETGTLSHFLNELHPADLRGAAARPFFINAGVNGEFPLALEGLVRYYGQSMRHQKVILHCNLLWMSSPEADLSSPKEQTFNHASLVPQFRYPLPCYRASRNDRLGIVISRSVPALNWVQHLQYTYFDGQSIPAWTLAEGADRPYQNPLGQIVPRSKLETGSSDIDPERGPASSRHRNWQARQLAPQYFEWVSPENSLQWRAFQRLVHLLQQRDNDLLVIVGPFNEAMIVDSARPPFHQWVHHVQDWLEKSDVANINSPSLPTNMYGDASHPLTEGYRTWAERLWSQPGFQEFCGTASDTWGNRTTLNPPARN